MGEITILLNGENTRIKTTSITALLAQLKLDVNHVIVEINHQIIPKEELNKTNLSHNDTVEIIRYIGGGKI